MAKKVSRGLSELLANVEDVRGERPQREERVTTGSTVPISKITPNPDQPRKTFPAESLKELSDSIASHGIIQPLIVKKDGSRYIIIAGERRYRAAKMAGLVEIPVIVTEMDGRKTREVSLIENLQREDLNAIEEGEAIKELMQMYDLTQEEVAKKLGKARPSIANTLRLLALSKEVMELVRGGTLSAGHARTLLPVSDKAKQLEMALVTIEEGISVRELEKRVRYYLNPEKAPRKITEAVKVKMTREMQEFVDDMTRVFSTKVKLMGNEQKGRITIDYFTNDDLQRIYETIERIKRERG